MHENAYGQALRSVNHFGRPPRPWSFLLRSTILLGPINSLTEGRLD
ncbi:MAG: hypothetical protein AAGA56_16440 [Myxococcota bacterium]